MNCKELREEFVFLFADNEMGQERLVAFRRHVADCPDCAQQAEFTCRLLTIVRKRAVRWEAPSSLRARILAGLPHRQRGPAH